MPIYNTKDGIKKTQKMNSHKENEKKKIRFAKEFMNAGYSRADANYMAEMMIRTRGKKFNIHVIKKMNFVAK